MTQTESNSPLVVALDLSRGGEAQAIAERWGLEALANGFQLQLTAEHLQLVQQGGQDGPVFVDFVAGAVAHRRRFGGGRGQSIAKAVGLKGGANPTVVDVTGGLGRDAFVLASLGCRVTLVERSAVVAALLEDGLARAREDAEIGPWIGERLQLVHAEAVSWMEALDEEAFPEVVYLDPMFPHRRKSALVKKEMRLLQALLGGDADADALLPAALRIARKRVVVKRPDYAPHLAGMKPTMSITSKKHRFDVYVVATVH
ncbi:MAG: class I SAM-dependent methyltransferase [Gammaproteobacteria bacterium]|nr:class I SAM-dependent methyltransferase [Gammaproteobacteria bacterium]MCW8973366.1 class I SAM-dependent methyltransferase [Gammaproteobacteria bacterium]MCW8994024.1 class I SAM-dependent methyltransferase [Gammaproteobacteria bacterium]